MNTPKEVNLIIEKLEKTKYQAYIGGGCVRDLLLGQKPKDWDITTNAKPQEIQKIFKKSFYENKFGTVTIITDSKDETLKTIEITPFRLEGKYSDKRHPDEIKFDEKGKKGKKGEIEQAQLTDEQVAELWMRRIQTSPAQFLKLKFRYQTQMQSTVEN